MSKEQLEAQLFYLLQKIYFDSIDNSKVDEAVVAMHPEVRWVHNQVWEHDGHKSEVTDILEGKESVKDFLTRRVIERISKMMILDWLLGFQRLCSCQYHPKGLTCSDL